MTRVIGAKNDQHGLPESARVGHPAGSLSPTKRIRKSSGMSRSIHCLHCGVLLNLPPQAAGHRVRCPKCGGRFHVEPQENAPKPASSAESTVRNADSTFELSPKASSVELPVMPVSSGDLRDTFNVPMMTEADTTPAAPKAKTAHAAHEADATALFEDKPAPRKKKTGAEARAQARRCPTCGGVVPAGMSICQTCGLDLETGMRVGLDDDLSPPPAPKSDGLPIGMLIIGGLCFAASVASSIVATVLFFKKTPGVIYFVPVGLFGVYASVQFLRERSVKLLLVALTLGAMIDLIGLVALPIIRAQDDVEVVQREGTDTSNESDPDAESISIRNPADLLDTNQLSAGITLLVLYTVLCVYLLSPPVQKHFRK